MTRSKLTRFILAAVALALSAESFAVEWNVSLWGKRCAFTEHVEKLAELVYAKTSGEFTLNLSYGGLSKARDNLDGISAGAFEMAQFCAGYHGDKNPTITVLELPFLGVKTLGQERVLSQALYTHPAVVDDLGRWNATLLMPSPQPQNNIVGVGEPPKTLSDYEGLRVRATGGIGKAMAAIGAVPFSLTATEVRQALKNGQIEAVAFAPHAHMSYGTADSAKWWTTNLNPGTINCPIVVNSDALAALSGPHRDALLGSVDAALDHYVANYNGKTMQAWVRTLDEKRIERITYNQEELSAFRNAVAGPAATAWIEENTVKGLPAQELYGFVKGMIAIFEIGALSVPTSPLRFGMEK